MKVKNIFLFAISMLFLAGCGRGTALLNNTQVSDTNGILSINQTTDAVVSGQYIIKRKGKAYLVSNQGLQQQLGLTVVKTIQNMGVDLVTGTPEAIAELKNNSDFEYVEPNYIRQIDAVTATAAKPTYLTTQSTWKTNAGKNFVTVSILGTGIDFKHPDLAKKIVTGYNAVDINGEENDNNGQGTLLGGLIVGANKTMGIAALAPECRIMGVKVLKQDGTGNDFSIMDGMAWAVDHGAKVILLPANGQASSKALSDAIKYASLNNASVVVPVGDKAQTLYPASDPGVIAVASDTVTKQASVSAFGGSRSSTYPTSMRQGNFKQGYGSINGTAAAAADVSALLSLIYSQYPDLSPVEARRIIETSSTSGRINPAKALATKKGTAVQASSYKTNTTVTRSTR